MAGVAAILLLFYCGLLLMVVGCLLSWWVWVRCMESVAGGYMFWYWFC